MLERAAGAPHRRDVGKDGFVAHQGAQARAGRRGLLFPELGQAQGVIGRVAVGPFVDVAFRFGMADEEDAGRVQRKGGVERRAGRIFGSK